MMRSGKRAKRWTRRKMKKFKGTKAKDDKDKGGLYIYLYISISVKNS